MIFDKHTELLVLSRDENGDFSWTVQKALWTHLKETAKTNLFSKIGLGAKTAEFTLRKTNGITLHNAFLCGGRFYFLTDIQPDGVVLLDITAACVRPVQWTLYRCTQTQDVYAGSGEPERLFCFPAPCVEKYLKFSQETPMAQTEASFVLVTPKAIELRVSDLVESSLGSFAVRMCHTLDEFKNEYEVYRKVDV